jgi:hypothetical protein
MPEQQVDPQQEAEAPDSLLVFSCSAILLYVLRIAFLISCSCLVIVVYHANDLL